MKYELQQMRKQGNGAIVFFNRRHFGRAAKRNDHAAKHGVIGLTKSAALEYASQGIRINSICPNIIHTPMVDKMMAGGQQELLDAMIEAVPARRLGRSEEIASAVLWLCSDMASLVVGHTLVVDGWLQYSINLWLF